jgi:tRNA(Ile)-lysidine synthase TilS/MesJ
MRYCNYCLQPDTRPNSVFTDEGVCPACNYFQELQHVDWQERFETLEDLLQMFPRKSGSFFDCIIGVSGGKDSTRQALWVRDRLG